MNNLTVKKVLVETLWQFWNGCWIVLLRDKHISSARGGFKLHVNHLTLCPANAEIKWSYQAVSLCRHYDSHFKKKKKKRSTGPSLNLKQLYWISTFFTPTWNHMQTSCTFLMAQFRVWCVNTRTEGEKSLKKGVNWDFVSCVWIHGHTKYYNMWK